MLGEVGRMIDRGGGLRLIVGVTNCLFLAIMREGMKFGMSRALRQVDER